MNVILLAAPAAGKGTQSELLVNNFKLNHVSTGNLLRELIKKDTDLGKKIKNIIESGNLVSDDIVIDSNITFCVDGSEITNNSNKEKSNKTKNENLFNCKILEFIKIIGNHKYSADFIKEVETNLLISKGMDDKLVLYSPQYQLIHVKKFYDWIYNMSF